MAGRRSLHAVVLFAVILHGIAISQTLLPAQDGLKFIRIAREFHTHPWADVIRGSDAHPLYPALIAAVEPIVAWFTSPGPAAWRTAAQIVAVLASVALILPIYGITMMLFDRRIACMAAGLAVLLPRAAELGHDTLSDSLGLMCTFLSLWLASLSLRRHDWRLAAVSGLVAGLGYLARPEVILVPGAFALTWLVQLLRTPRPRALARVPALLASVVCALAVVGSYAMVKGEISEKISVRVAAKLGPKNQAVRRSPRQLPRGLDDPRWDFSPKEEGERIPIHGVASAIGRIVGKWWEELCWLFAVMTIWGLARQRFIRGICLDRDPDDSNTTERQLLLVFTIGYLIALVRHSVLLGYLSGRHIMPVVYMSLPWAAAGSFVCAGHCTQAALESIRTAHRRSSGGVFDCRRIDRRADAAQPSESPQPVGPLGRGPLACRACPGKRVGARYSRLGQIRFRSPRVRLLARQPGPDRLAPGVHRRRAR